MLSKGGLETEAATKQRKGRPCSERIPCPKHSWDRAVEKEWYMEQTDNGPIPVMVWEAKFFFSKTGFFTASVPKGEAQRHLLCSIILKFASCTIKKMHFQILKVGYTWVLTAITHTRCMMLGSLVSQRKKKNQIESLKIPDFHTV